MYIVRCFGQNQPTNGTDAEINACANFQLQSKALILNIRGFGLKSAVKQNKCMASYIESISYAGKRRESPHHDYSVTAIPSSSVNNQGSCLFGTFWCFNGTHVVIRRQVVCVGNHSPKQFIFSILVSKSHCCVTYSIKMCLPTTPNSKHMTSSAFMKKQKSRLSVLTSSHIMFYRNVLSIHSQLHVSPCTLVELLVSHNLQELGIPTPLS